MNPDFSRVRFVICEPSHPGNVGSAARAIKTMGFEELVLVAPKIQDVCTHPEAVALASGAVDVLDQAQVVDSLEQALSPVTMAFAMTARPRDLGPTVCDIRQAADFTQRHLQSHPAAKVAMVMGTERSGLTNAQIDLCHRVCHIPANPSYSSLNVSQAIQLAAWELRYALTGPGHLPSTELKQPDPGKQPASAKAVHALLSHLEQALIDVKFLDPQHPKKLMPRMRHLFQRSDMSKDEVDMWRGVCTAMIQTARRSPPSSDRQG